MNPSSEVSFIPFVITILVVSNDINTLVRISNMLQRYHYQVTLCKKPTKALEIIGKGDIKFDMVITDVNFSPDDMPGLEFIEIIQNETDLPVIVMSAEGDTKVLMEHATKGPKPNQMDGANLSQLHVDRIKMLCSKRQVKNEPNSSKSMVEKERCGSSTGVPIEGEQHKVQGFKHRLVWTPELHKKFLDAMEQLGSEGEDVVPKRIKELMNVPGLTRLNVASHLQKYRDKLKKIAKLSETSSFEAVPVSTLSSMDVVRLRIPPAMEHN